MSSEPAEGTRHAERVAPYEWISYELDDQTLVVHDVPEGIVDCYRVVGTTRNPRAVITCDAVLYEGTIVEPFYEETYGCIKLQHSYAGGVARPRAEEWFEEPVVKLERCPVAGTAELADH